MNFIAVPGNPSHSLAWGGYWGLNPSFKWFSKVKIEQNKPFNLLKKGFKRINTVILNIIANKLNLDEIENKIGGFYLFGSSTLENIPQL